MHPCGLYEFKNKQWYQIVSLKNDSPQCTCNIAKGEPVLKIVHEKDSTNWCQELKYDEVSFHDLSYYFDLQLLNSIQQSAL